MITNTKIVSSGNKGIGHLRPIYDDVQNEFMKSFVSCGTTVGHLLHGRNISVSRKEDKKNGIFECGWANDLLISSMAYCNSSTNQEQKKYASYNKLCKRDPYPEPVKRIEMYTPTIIFYDAKEMRDLIPEKGKWNEKRKHSTNYIPGDQEAFLGEYQINHVSLLPKPKFYLIGKCSRAMSKEERDSFSYSLSAFEEGVGKVIYLPEASLKANSMDTQVNIIALKFMQWMLEKG